MGIIIACIIIILWGSIESISSDGNFFLSLLFLIESPWIQLYGIFSEIFFPIHPEADSDTLSIMDLIIFLVAPILNIILSYWIGYSVCRLYSYSQKNNGTLYEIPTSRLGLCGFSGLYHDHPEE